MELLHYWRIVRKRWWVVLLVVILAVGATAAYTLQRPTEYQSTSTLLLNPAVPSSLVPYVQAQVASNLADSYTELMQTDSFATSVAKELNNALSPGTIAGAIQTRLVPNTLFYKITAQAGNPQTARQIADAVVKVFLSANQSPAQAQVDGGLTQNQKDMRDRLTSKLSYLSDEIKSYQDQIDTLQKQTPSKDRDDQLLQLRGLLVSLEQSETDTMVAVANITKDDSGQNTAIVVDPAQPGAPVPSPLTRNLLLAFIASFALGIGLSFFLDYLDYTVRSPEYLEQVLGLTPMAVIGIVRGQASLAYGRARRRQRQGARNGKTAAAQNGDGKAEASTNLVALEYPKSPESESFRVLRTNIQFSSLETPVRKLVVTSGAPGEGKSFTASNLAVVMAQSGKRVILVDTDLRRPSLHKLFGLPNTAGFTSLVVGHLSEAEKAAVLQRIPDVPNLRVITSGPLPPNPSELLNSGEAAKVMQQISQAGDVIIYDTPPVTAVTDPAILATRVDAVIYVINAGVTRRFMVERVLRILDTVGVKTVLPVLNRVKLQDIHGYYYYSGKNYGTTSEPELSTNGHHANGRTAEVASFDGVRLDAHQDE